MTNEIDELGLYSKEVERILMQDEDDDKKKKPKDEDDKDKDEDDKDKESEENEVNILGVNYPRLSGMPYEDVITWAQQYRTQSGMYILPGIERPIPFDIIRESLYNLMESGDVETCIKEKMKDGKTREEAVEMCGPARSKSEKNEFPLDPYYYNEIDEHIGNLRALEILSSDAAMDAKRNGGYSASNVVRNWESVLRLTGDLITLLTRVEKKRNI